LAQRSFGLCKHRLRAAKAGQQFARCVVAYAIGHAQAQPSAQLVFVHVPLLWNVKSIVRTAVALVRCQSSKTYKVRRLVKVPSETSRKSIAVNTRKDSYVTLVETHF
jgi:hypothetical protein